MMMMMRRITGMQQDGLCLFVCPSDFYYRSQPSDQRVNLNWFHMQIPRSHRLSLSLGIEYSCSIWIPLLRSLPLPCSRSYNNQQRQIKFIFITCDDIKNESTLKKKYDAILELVTKLRMWWLSQLTNCAHIHMYILIEINIYSLAIFWMVTKGQLKWHSIQDFQFEYIPFEWWKMLNASSGDDEEGSARHLLIMAKGIQY